MVEATIIVTTDVHAHQRQVAASITSYHPGHDVGVLAARRLAAMCDRETERERGGEREREGDKSEVYIDR